MLIEGPEEQLSCCAEGLQCKGHTQLAEGTALVTEGTRVACPTETLRGLWGHLASGEGGQSQGEGVVVTEPLPVSGLSLAVPMHWLSCHRLPSLLPFSLKFLNYIIYWETVRSK